MPDYVKTMPWRYTVPLSSGVTHNRSALQVLLLSLIKTRRSADSELANAGHCCLAALAQGDLLSLLHTCTVPTEPGNNNWNGLVVYSVDIQLIYITTLTPAIFFLKTYIKLLKMGICSQRTQIVASHPKLKKPCLSGSLNPRKYGIEPWTERVHTEKILVGQRVGKGGPEYADPGYTGESFWDDSGKLKRRQLLDSYAQHTQKCSACKKVPPTV